MFASKDLFLTRPSGYQISRSVRLRSSATAYFNKTPASAGNRKTWTWSGWVKRGKLNNGSGTQYIFACTYGANDASFMEIYFPADDSLALAGYSANYRQSTQVFRDPSAWYHIVVAFDTTQATGANRVKLYVNGVQITSFSASTDPTLNTDYPINNSQAHYIGDYSIGTPTSFFDGYLTEINFIDGQALTPSSFGQTNTITGVWQPIKYTGTYGTNGFYLNFSDNSAATATTIGKDYSGNGNNWTPNNISVTAGTTYDSMTDVPTLTSATAANYAVMNPLNNNTGATWNIASFQAANLNVGSAADNQNKIAVATMEMTTGKFYWEVTIGSNFPSTYTFVGMTQRTATGITKNVGIYYRNDGQKSINGTNSAYGASYTTGDVIGFAYDADAGVLTCYKNNSSQGAIYSSGAGSSWMPTMAADNAGAGVTYYNSFNFGQRPFTYTPPTGFVALNTQNLPTPTISNGATVMAASTYTGTGATQTIANSGNNAASISFKPDLVWIKSRSAATNNNLFDSVRGTTDYLISNSTAAAATNANTLTAFGTTGFTVGSDASALGVNVNAATYVAWQWQAGQGNTSSNTSGSITSTVSVNATAGFSIVTYSGTSVVGTIGHGLGVAPSMIIVKSRNTAGTDWATYHASIGATAVIALNSTGTPVTIAGSWNNTAPTSSVFTVGTGSGSGDTNFSGRTYVAYCFAAVAGYSAFGSYTGNGSTDGPFIFTGFRPRFIMIKRTDAVGGWTIEDSSRDTYNVTQYALQANQAFTEATLGAYPTDFLSNGFKIRTTSTDYNANTGTFIYMAFAESPFKLALAR